MEYVWNRPIRIVVYYSKEDSAYVAVVPEFPGCSAFGKTECEALGEVKKAADLWLESVQAMLGVNTKGYQDEENYCQYGIGSL